MVTAGSRAQIAAESTTTEATYRLWIRRAGEVVVGCQALAFVVGALLPTTPAADRAGLLFGAGLVLITGALWFLVIPHNAFGEDRVFVACAIAQVVLVAVLIATSGVRSFYFPYYLLPLLVIVMAGSPAQTLTLGSFAALGLVALVLTDPGGPAQLDVIDLFTVRLLQVVAFSIAAGAASRATGAIRRALAARVDALGDLARSDPLTGLGNRQRLYEDLTRLLAAAARTGKPMSVVAIDLDGVKAINDRGGHAAGDRVLVDFARTLREQLRGQDVAIRSGGDEFALLLPETDQMGVSRTLERIRDGVAAASGDSAIGFSAGSVTSSIGASPEWLLAIADDALYTQKANRSGTRTARGAATETR